MSTWQYEPVSVSAVALLSHKSLEVQEQDTDWTGQRIQRSPLTTHQLLKLPQLTECITDAILDDSPFFSADSLCRQSAASEAPGDLGREEIVNPSTKTQ